MATDPLTAAGISALGKTLSEAAKLSINPASKKIAEWKTPAKIRALAKNMALAEKVKTFISLDKPIKISDFFLPPSFQYAINSKGFMANTIEDFGIEEHPLIEGTAGYGKSIFMRHLYAEEMRAGKRVPLFVELRKITSATSLKRFLTDQLEALGFPEPSYIFDFLAESGQLLILLDGFDELREEFRTSFISDLENLVTKYSLLKIVITSRPESSINGVSFLRTVKIQPLTIEGQDALIQKMCSKETAKHLTKGLRKNESLNAIAVTPLFITLLCVAYRAEQHIPESAHEFYELVFNTLLYRHDAIKPGYERPRKTKFGNHQFRKIFASFSFECIKLNIIRFDKNTALKIIESTLKTEGVDTAQADKFLDDLTKITCLLVKDGIDDLQFVHKSIAEYFAASYLEKSPDAFAKKVYAHFLNSVNGMNIWAQVLIFLKDIDTYRYAKYFELPALHRMINPTHSGSLANISWDEDQLYAVYGGKYALRISNFDPPSWVLTYVGFSSHPKNRAALEQYFRATDPFAEGVSSLVQDYAEKLKAAQNNIEAERASGQPKNQPDSSIAFWLKDWLSENSLKTVFVSLANRGSWIKETRIRLKTFEDFIVRTEQKDADFPFD